VDDDATPATPMDVVHSKAGALVEFVEGARHQPVAYSYFDDPVDDGLANHERADVRMSASTEPTTPQRRRER